ncbi:MAG: glycosyltransferase family 4 protein [Prolixibacteraceae bacterium]|jgi:glycosyltransferase involved in cell wall biosynthesis|nr:glycosyltransferase family 4 protein [Prolixibacteraceae bacterium]
MKKQKTIVHLIFSFNTGGAETMLVDILNEQCQFAKCMLIIVNNNFDEQLICKVDNRVEVIYINRLPQSKNIFLIVKLNALLFRLKPFVIHCHNHNLVKLILPAFYKKSVLTIHAVAIKSKYFNKYHKLFAISESVKQDLYSRYQLDSIIVYNGIITSNVSINYQKKVDAPYKIVVVGRLFHEIKGQDVLIKALSQLKDTKHQMVIDFIGTGPSELYLKSLVKELGVSKQVNFLGLKDREYIYAHLKDYDLLVQPSIFEGFGLTVAEAMAAKVTVLVSNTYGPMEIIDEGKYGFYFENGNIDSLVQSLESIVKMDSKTITEISEKAYTRVVDLFDIKLTAKRYLELY